MKNIFKIIVLFLIFGVFNTFGFDIKSLGTINSYVIDQAGVLNKEDKNLLENQIASLNQKYTTEVLVVLLKTLSGENISSVGTQIGQEIGVGKDDKDNGVVVLIAIDDREWNISTGYGVEGVLPDILTNKLGEKNFVLFREGKYFDGISGLLTDFGKAFEGDPSIISLKNNSNNNEDEGFNILAIVIAIIGSLIFGSINGNNFKQKKYKKIIKYTIIGWLILLPLFIFSLLSSSIIWFVGTFIGALLGSSAPTSGGGGGGWSDYSSSRNSSSSFGSSSSSGFGGFGGGGFGGGGSSGKW